MTFLDKHPGGADDEGEEGARPVELVDDLGPVVGGGGGAVVESLDLCAVLVVVGLEVCDEDEAGGGEGAQEERDAVEQAEGPEMVSI